MGRARRLNAALVQKHGLLSGEVWSRRACIPRVSSGRFRSRTRSFEASILQPALYLCNRQAVADQ